TFAPGTPAMRGRAGPSIFPAFWRWLFAPAACAPIWRMRSNGSQARIQAGEVDTGGRLQALAGSVGGSPAPKSAALPFLFFAAVSVAVRTREAAPKRRRTRAP